jgi:hypothetical protein
MPLRQKIEAIEGIVPARHSLVGRCAATGLMQQRIADLANSMARKLVGASAGLGSSEVMRI